MPLTFDELKEQLAIDKSVLDDEVIRQPVLFYTISEMLTEALAQKDAAKEELATVDADLDSHWRKTLKKADEKSTDSIVKSHVQGSAAHERAFDAYLKAKTHSDRLLSLKEAFQQRSYMLRDLVSLYTANYYEESSIKPTRAQEASQYANNRLRISNAREARGK